MSESAKTFAFIAAAALAVGAAVVTRPTTGEFDVSDLIGKPLTQGFQLDQAKRMTIVEFDEATATSKTFDVAEQAGLWSLPSKGGYPADAEEQLARAVNEIADREILLIASEDPSDHEQFGVIDPTSEKLEPGQTGVGTRVSLSASDGESLADVIIGKEVKDQDNQRYVRRNKQDLTYIVEIDPTNFSTDFADWIEDDLLKLSPWDILRVRVRDYTAELFLTLQGPAVETTFRTDMTFGYNDGDSKWLLEDFQQASNERTGEFKPASLGEDQELDEDKLGELKNALDDLKIVDVSSKPESLSANLKAGEDILKDEASLRSLIGRGFAPTRNAAGELDILSSEGEVICTMKDGVEYVLRFGNLKLSTAKAEDQPADATESSENQDEGVDRYLFVMARLNEGVIEAPELVNLPPLPAGAAEQSEEQATEEEPPANEAVDSAANGAATDGANDAANDGANDAEPRENTDAAADEEADQAEAVETQDEPSELRQAVAARKEAEEQNARLLDEYEEKLAEGRKRVKELNARFGDWYYVISNDVYEKIHLSLTDVTKTKESEEGEAGDSDDSPAAGASAFGAPGSAVPGMPGLQAALEDGEAQQPAEQEGSEKVTDPSAAEDQ